MNQEFTQTTEYFDFKVKEYFAHRRAEAKDVTRLHDSMEYSLLNGGKRFRPMLCFAVAEALGLQKEEVLPFAMAVESVHTYSLIHDDLPCMDDDSERRGQPTNHIKFSEDVALLAGDALLTEAPLILARAYAEKSPQLIEILSEGSGLNGMIRGQMLDLGHGDKITALSDLINLHELKTGRLIAMCFTGPGYLAGRELGPLNELGLMIGLAFQVKDDLLDVEDEDLASFISFLGVEGTEQHLASLTEKIETSLKELSLNRPFLMDLIQFNLNRQK